MKMPLLLGQTFQHSKKQGQTDFGLFKTITIKNLQRLIETKSKMKICLKWSWKTMESVLSKILSFQYAYRTKKRSMTSTIQLTQTEISRLRAIPNKTRNQKNIRYK